MPLSGGDLGDFAAAVRDVVTAMPGAVPILPATYTVDTLPDPAALIGKYARVSDLFGDTTDLVLAAQTGALSYWKPVRPVMAAKKTVAVDMTLTALKSPSVLLLDGSVGLGTTRKITLATQLAFPGASFRIKQRNTLGTILGALNVLNVNLGTPVSILTGGTQEFVYDMADGWVQVT